MRQIADGPFTALTSSQSRAAAAAAARALTQRRSGRIDAAAAPLLTRSPAGARFSRLDGHRGFAIGVPPALCPNTGVATGVAAAEAADAALGACLADRGAGDPDCGCVLIALDDAVFAPRAALAYAPGVAARLLGQGAPGGLLVAEERPSPAGRHITFRDAGGPLAEADISERGAVTLTRDGHVWTGRASAFGRLRGRLAERWRLRDESGRRLTALIGFEPGALR